MDSSTKDVEPRLYELVDKHNREEFVRRLVEVMRRRDREEVAACS